MTVSEAESFARYHDEHAGHGGVSWEFHARAATFLRAQAAEVSRLKEEVALARSATESAEAGRAEASRLQVRAEVALAKEREKVETMRSAWRHHQTRDHHHSPRLCDLCHLFDELFARPV